jgi:hypothetical protein
MCGPSLVLPRTLLPRHSHTDAHDGVHTSPCILWRAQTWHAGTRAHTATPTPAARPRHLPCSSPRCRRRAVAASAPPQHARDRRQGASWSPPCSSPRCRRRAVVASAPPQHARKRRQSANWSTRTGEQACGQRRGHSKKSRLGRRRRSLEVTLPSGHAPAQAHCSRGSHGRPPVLCTLHANACAHGPDGKAFTYLSMHKRTRHGSDSRVFFHSRQRPP